MARRLRAPESRAERGGEEKSLCLCKNPRLSSSQRSDYTVWATPVPIVGTQDTAADKVHCNIIFSFTARYKPG